MTLPAKVASLAVSAKAAPADPLEEGTEFTQREKLLLLGELAADVAHELRNPLVAIGGFAQSLSRSANLSEADRDKLDIIFRETQRMERLTAGILSFVRPKQCGHSVNLAQISRECAQLMGASRQAAGITFLVNCAEDVWAAFCPDQARQCVLNLVKNSLEALGGSGMLALHTSMEQGMAMLRVSDTGGGLKGVDTEKVFKPFCTTKETGTGLGLPMVRRLVEAQGGSVHLESAENWGTVVTLRFRPGQNPAPPS